MKTKKIKGKDLTEDGLKKLINRDIKEINHLSERDLISLWSFFKCLCTDRTGQGVVFVTNKNSLIHRHRKELQKNIKIKIELTEEFMAG